MPFPEVRRVIYNKNPLDRVICQLRFPPILKIDSEIPSEFQDKIRNDFPNFLEKSAMEVDFPQNVKGKIPIELLRQFFQRFGNKNYEFASEDGQWQINLTRTFLSFSTIKYKRWEEFKSKLNGPLLALIDVYKPAFFSRIGLRYIDVINRSYLGLSHVAWNDLLKPYILGLLSSQGVGERIQNFETKYEISLSDELSKVRLITKFIMSVNKSEKCFMIDSDFYYGNKTKIEAALEKLDYFNKRASRLIQWCITQRLHQAMEPYEV